jgi:hypothetical protein
MVTFVVHSHVGQLGRTVSRLVEVHIDALQLKVGVAHVLPLRVNAMLVTDHLHQIDLGWLV